MLHRVVELVHAGLIRNTFSFFNAATICLLVLLASRTAVALLTVFVLIKEH